METIFKVGQKVWDNALGFGEGEVEKVGHNPHYPIDVLFENARHNYTFDGRFDTHLSSTLSTTPYTLTGFSQESPKEEKQLLI